MATATTEDEGRLLAGFYNPKKRKEQVLAKLEKELEIFRKLDFTRDLADQLQVNSEFQKEKSLDAIEEEIGNLITEVDRYFKENRDGHFTKQYRTFQGGFDKLLQQLDSVNVGSDVDLKEQRRRAIERIQNSVAFINKNVHEDGKCCTQCELYGTMWQ